MLVLLAALAPALAGPGDYTVDAGDSVVYALVWKDGLAAAAAHDHAIRPHDVSGTVHWEEDPAGSRSARVEVKTSSILADEDDMRAKAGLDGTLKEGQRASILKSILDEDQLWASHFPTIAFESTQVEPSGDAWLATGTFSLRGASHTVSVPLTVEPDGDGLRVQGKFQLTQSQFGYKPFSAGFGTLKVKDLVDVVVDLRLDPVE